MSCRRDTEVEKTTMRTLDGEGNRLLIERPEDVAAAVAAEDGIAVFCACCSDQPFCRAHDEASITVAVRHLFGEDAKPICPTYARRGGHLA